MNRALLVAVVIALVSVAWVSAVPMPETLMVSQARVQDQTLVAVETVALIHQLRPVMDVLQARRLVVDHVLVSNAIDRENKWVRSEDMPHFPVRDPMSWELLSMVPDARLYALFTAADLGGYGDNEPPYEPGNPFPTNGATGVSRTVTLEWTGGDPNAGDMVYYDLYFGTAAVPPLMASSLTMESYAMADLTPGTLYYWKIVARDNWDATTEGQIWSFTTVPNDPPYEPVNPIPPDTGVDIDINANLSWQCNDPNPGDTLTYDLFFGTDNPPPRVGEALTSPAYDPGQMEQNTTYYWYILARDVWGAETVGPTWSFTTMAGANNPPYEPANPVPADH
ncbi:hypothetical protein JXA80_14240, partial [bacterium]|nr:hypothetical protein [candidate division CSSED10-310 bacterium]